MGSPHAFDAMAFFDEHGCSRTELALREVRGWPSPAPARPRISGRATPHPRHR